MKNCEGCGREFAPNYPEQKYHNHACFVQAMNRDRTRQQTKGVKGGQVRGEQKRAEASGEGYVKVPGDVHAHRWVAEQTLGRTLLPGEVVHHEDRNKQNNDPINLIVFESQAEHARHHKLNHENHQPCECRGTRLKEVISNVQ